MKIEFSELRGLEKLGKGSFGVIYKVPPGAIHPDMKQPLALKKYKKSVLEENELAIDSYLRNLIEARRSAPVDVRPIMDQYTIWPKALVFEDGHACGFVMNLIPSKFFVEIDNVMGRETIEQNFDKILDTDELRIRLGMPVITGSGKARITYDLLRIIATLHKSGFVIGDISPNNILVYVDEVNQSKNRVLIIDSDSFRKMNSIHPLSQPHTGGWIPPEALEAGKQRRELARAGGDPFEISSLAAKSEVQNKQTDVFKLCLAILRLYHAGDERTIIESSDSARERITKHFGGPFWELIDRGLTAAALSRPNAEDMLAAYEDALRQKKGSR
jgi:serine/threonine protein kinase